jgi:hypothetical protein
MGRQQDQQLVSCPYCHRYPLEKSRGLAGHIRQTATCQQRQNELLSDMLAHNTFGSASPSDPPSTQPLENSRNCNARSPRGLLADQDIGLAGDQIDASDPENDNIEDTASGHQQINPSGPWKYRARDPRHEPVTGKYIGTRWEKLKSDEKPDLPHYPWASQEEFDVVNWLSTEGLSQKGIDRFLKLQYASIGTNYPSAHKINDHYCSLT